MKKIIVVLIITISTFSLKAQSNVWKINWDMNAPIGKTSDFTSKFSLRGLSVDASWFLGDHFALGGTVAWGLFYEKTGKITETYYDENVAVSSRQKKYNNFVPLLLNGEYYFGNSGHVRPYLGLGVGATWSELMKNIGLYQIYNKSWMFTLAPEVGIMIPIVNNFNAHIKAKYLQGLWSEGDNLQTFTISVGFAFTSYRY